MASTADHDSCTLVRVSRYAAPTAWHPEIALIARTPGRAGNRGSKLHLDTRWEISGSCASRIDAINRGTFVTDQNEVCVFPYDGGVKRLPASSERSPAPINTPFLDGRPSSVTTRLDEGRYMGAWSTGTSIVLATFRDWPGYPPHKFARTDGVVRALDFGPGLHGRDGVVIILALKGGRYTLSYVTWVEGE